MHKADSVVVTAQGGDNQYEPHPEGVFLARCVDVIDLGEKVESYLDGPKKLVPKLALVYVTGEVKEFNGQPELHTLTKEFSATFGEKANLRKWATAWRGKSYKDSELVDGVDFGKMCGAFAQISVEHVTSRQGRVYANIASIGPVMKGVEKPSHLGAEYERPKYLSDKKGAYAVEAAAFKKEIGADVPPAVNRQPAKGFDAPPPPEPEDELPF